MSWASPRAANTPNSSGRWTSPLPWSGYPTSLVYVETLRRRSQPHIYVANWFYLAFIVAVALLHIFNNLAVPVSLTKSYSLFSGVQDAMTQWWYGHNAVGFFLTAAFLGMMYYFVPKQAGRPVYSYRLSIIHFWALIFLYMWAGGHHLHWTSLPGLGIHPGGNLLRDSAHALLGWHDQRHHDPVRRVG
jgi:cbb3-type cytochrome c oxidase subunit I